jgi:hypothetical protein
MPTKSGRAPSRAKTPAAEQALLDQMAADAPEPSEDQLAVIRRLAAEMRELEMENAEMKEEIRRNNERMEEIRWRDLLAAMDKAGMRNFTLEAEGNLPARFFETGAYYHANIAADWPEDQRAKSFAWIKKYEPGMLRNTLTVSFGKGSMKQQQAAQAALRKLKIDFETQFGVPWNTLTSYVKEQIEVHKKTPPLDLLGAKVGRVATMKQVKEKL